jgi:hypothetical protein
MDGLFLLLLEAAVALALLLFIVWWTWPRRKPRDGLDGETTSRPASRSEKPGDDH